MHANRWQTGESRPAHVLSSIRFYRIFFYRTDQVCVCLRSWRADCFVSALYLCGVTADPFERHPRHQAAVRLWQRQCTVISKNPKLLPWCTSHGTKNETKGCWWPLADGRSSPMGGSGPLPVAGISCLCAQVNEWEQIWIKISWWSKLANCDTN